jgi:transposase
MRYELSDYEWAAIRPLLPEMPLGNGGVSALSTSTPNCFLSHRRRPTRRAAHATCRAARNAAASDALDAAVKIAFLSAFNTASQDVRYCA